MDLTAKQHSSIATAWKWAWPVTSTVCVHAWNRVRPEHVIELLDTATPAARWDARNIAAQISRGSWRIHMDAAVVGKPQLVSNVREVLITAGGRDYRLKISEGVRLQLEEIAQSA